MTNVEQLKNDFRDNIFDCECEAKELLERLQKARQQLNECESVDDIEELNDSLVKSLDKGFKFLSVF